MLRMSESVINYIYKDHTWMRVQPCVQQFIEWLTDKQDVHNILDLGTGGHHAVGFFAAGKQINTVGTTVCVEDIAKYESLYTSNPEIMKHYTMVYQNWFYFNAAVFREFDVILALDIAFYPIMIQYNTLCEVVHRLMKGLAPKGLLCLNYLLQRYEPGEITAADTHRIKNTCRLVNENTNSISYYKNLAFIHKEEYVASHKGNTSYMDFV